MPLQSLKYALPFLAHTELCDTIEEGLATLIDTFDSACSRLGLPCPALPCASRVCCCVVAVPRFCSGELRAVLQDIDANLEVCHDFLRAVAPWSDSDTDRTTDDKMQSSAADSAAAPTSAAALAEEVMELGLRLNLLNRYRLCGLREALDPTSSLPLRL